VSYQLKITPEAKKQIQMIMDDTSKKGLQKQLKKALGHLQKDPRYSALKSHPLPDFSKVFGVKVWTSYVQNNTPAAHRILWAYGEGLKEIVILGVIEKFQKVVDLKKET